MSIDAWCRLLQYACTYTRLHLLTCHCRPPCWLCSRLAAVNMKFSQALKANSVPDWRHHYVHYSRLKKMIFRLEQLQNNNGSLTPVPEHRQSLDFSNHGSTAPLLDRRSPSMLQRASSGFENSHVDELMFEREIHEELARVKAFYVEKVCTCKCSAKLSTIALHHCLCEPISVQIRVMLCHALLTSCCSNVRVDSAAYNCFSRNVHGTFVMSLPQTVALSHLLSCFAAR